jgi:hypothetical protein
MCLTYIEKVVREYAAEVARLARPHASSLAVTGGDVLREVARQRNFEAEIVSLQEHNARQERTIRSLTRLIHDRLSKEVAPVEGEDGAQG